MTDAATMPSLTYDRDLRWGYPPHAQEKAADRGRREFVYLGAILLLVGTLQLAFLVGVTKSDSSGYASVCMTIADGSFRLNRPSLYSGRWLLVYPAALFFRCFGVSDLTAAAYPMGCSLGILTLTYLIGRRFCSTGVGLLATALLGFCPIYLVNSTVLLPDVPSAFYMTLSVYLFLVGDSSSSRVRWLLFLGAGTALGAAWAVKESAVILVVFYSAFLLLNWRRISILHVLVFLAAAGVFLIESAVYWWLVGNPLFRLQACMSPAGLAAAEHLTFSRWEYVRKLFISVNDFGLLFFLLLGALLYALARRRKDLVTPSVWFFAIYLYTTFGTLSLTSWRFIYANPRYLIPALIPACLLAAFWLYNIVRKSLVWMYYVVLTLFALSSLGFACLDYNMAVLPRDAAKWASQWLAKREPAVVYGVEPALLRFYSAGSSFHATMFVPYKEYFDGTRGNLSKGTGCYVVVDVLGTDRSDPLFGALLPEVGSSPEHWQVAATQTVSTGGLAGIAMKLANYIVERMPMSVRRALSADGEGLAQHTQVTIYRVPGDGGRGSGY